MNWFNIKLVVLINIFLIPCHSGEIEKSNEDALLFPEIYYSHDSEKFSTYKYRVGYYPSYASWDKNTSLSIQKIYYRQENWKVSSEKINFSTKNIDRKNYLGYNINFGYSKLNDKDFLTTDSSWSMKLRESTNIEFILNRDIVETRNSIENNINYILVGGAIDQNINDQLNAVVMIGNMKFSDSNIRRIEKAKLIYDISPENGVNIQLRYRQFHDSNIIVANNYFNPSNYKEVMIALGLRKRLNEWMLNGTAGIGKQVVNQDPSTITKLLEISATSPYASKSFFTKTRLGYGKSAGIGGPDYYYSYVISEIIFPF